MEVAATAAAAAAADSAACASDGCHKSASRAEVHRTSLPECCGGSHGEPATVLPPVVPPGSTCTCAQHTNVPPQPCALRQLDPR